MAHSLVNVDALIIGFYFSMDSSVIYLIYLTFTYKCILRLHIL